MKVYDSDHVRALAGEMAMAIINYVNCTNEDKTTYAYQLALVELKVKRAAIASIDEQARKDKRAILDHLAQTESP